MWKDAGSREFSVPYGQAEFAAMRKKLIEMKERERARFVADPQNTDVLRSYEQYRKRLRRRIVAPMTVTFVMSVGIGLFLVS